MEKESEAADLGLIYLITEGKTTQVKFDLYGAFGYLPGPLDLFKCTSNTSEDELEIFVTRACRYSHVFN